MDNVAKFNASQNQVAQAMNQASLEKGAIDNLEKSSTKIKKDGGSSGGNSSLYQGKGKKRRSSEEENKKSDGQQEISDPRLGLHVDITG